jgi:hypothetical protein
MKAPAKQALGMDLSMTRTPIQLRARLRGQRLTDSVPQQHHLPAIQILHQTVDGQGELLGRVVDALGNLGADFGQTLGT